MHTSIHTDTQTRRHTHLYAPEVLGEGAELWEQSIALALRLMQTLPARLNLRVNG